MDKVTITFTKAEFSELNVAAHLYNIKCVNEYLKGNGAYSKVLSSFELLNRVCKIEKEGA